MDKIIPSVSGQKKKDFLNRMSKVGFAGRLHMDIKDGKFVNEQSGMFKFKLPEGKICEAHMMIQKPLEWIKKNKKYDYYIIHYETFSPKAITMIKKLGKKTGIAINPETSIEKIKGLLGKIDMVVVMGVHPGRDGARFLPSTIQKVKKIRKAHKKIDIEVDGGVNPKNIKRLKKAGADLFISGSYVALAENPKKAFKTLKGALL